LCAAAARCAVVVVVVVVVSLRLLFRGYRFIFLR
jgi:hypothetical protein